VEALRWLAADIGHLINPCHIGTHLRNTWIRHCKVAGAAHLHSVLSKFNLRNYVSSPTRVTAHSAKVIDLFLSTVSIEGPCETVCLDVSDHFAVLARIVTVPQRHVLNPAAGSIA